MSVFKRHGENGFAKYADRAAAQLAVSGSFASKSKAQEALADVNRAYEAARDAMMEQLLAEYPHDDGGRRAEPFEALYWGSPYYPHQWNLKKHPALYAAYPEFCARALAMKELRDAIKAAPIEPKPVREDHPLLVLAKQAPADFAALMEKRNGQYRDALEIGRKNSGLWIQVHRVFCVNYAGTTWVRLDWYLEGQRKPFSVIAAAYEQLIEEGVIPDPRKA